MSPYEASLLDTCLLALREREPDLKKRGVLHAGIFGSVARRQDHADSDIDVAVEIKSGMGFGTSGLLDLERELTSIFQRRTEVFSLGGFKPAKHREVYRELIWAF
ncbi:MAG TPA: nucleotidyltransferase domain-containing protein [Dongiaceae bacterium]|nr:nucleotidyltransferase domain-containing protein [Dongiaceae bacterium]